jgi:hypothetical protein
MPIIPRLLVAVAPVVYAQSGIKKVDLPNLESAGRVEINNVPASYINLPGLRTIKDCPGIEYPLKPALAANNRGLELEKQADQYKDKGDIDQAKYHYKAAYEAYSEATKKEEELSCTDIDVFRRNGERILKELSNLKKLPNQEL